MSHLARKLIREWLLLGASRLQLYCVLKPKRIGVTGGDCDPVNINTLSRQFHVIEGSHLSENQKFGRFNEVTEEIELRTG